MNLLVPILCFIAGFIMGCGVSRENTCNLTKDNEEED